MWIMRASLARFGCKQRQAPNTGAALTRNGKMAVRAVQSKPACLPLSSVGPGAPLLKVPFVNGPLSPKTQQAILAPQM